MSQPSKDDKSSAIQAAIRAKRDKKSDDSIDLERREAELLAEIEQFDISSTLSGSFAAPETADARRPGASTGLVFPEIVGVGAFRTIAEQPVPTTGPAPVASDNPGSLLDRLRAQAENKLVEADQRQARHSLINRRIDQALKQLFFYLHDLVEQLNVIRPVVQRNYPLIENQSLEALAWQEGFADYRAQAQSVGGLVENVSLTYQLARDEAFRVRRTDLGVERFRNFLYDYGLFFSCKEYKNAQQQLEFAEFEIPAKLAVSARWRADFTNGKILLETRNLERFGNLNYVLRSEAVDQMLFDEFAKLILGEANTFRELTRR